MNDERLLRDELMHYGVARKSGRYKWGSGENPYHHGQSNPAGTKISRQERKAQKKLVKAKNNYNKRIDEFAHVGQNPRSLKYKRADKKVQKAGRNFERARKKYVGLREARLNKTDRKFTGEEDKEAVLRSGSASKIYAYRKQLTNKELGDAVARLNAEKKLKELSASEKKTKLDKFDDASKKIEKVGNIANRLMKTYDTAASVHNTFSSGKKWPRMDKGGDNKSAGTKAKASTAKSYADSFKKAAEKKVNEEAKRQAKQRAYAEKKKSDGWNFDDDDIVVDTPYEEVYEVPQLAAPRKKRRR